MLPGPHPWQAGRASWSNEVEREQPSRTGSYPKEAHSLVGEPDSSQVTPTINAQSQMKVPKGFSGQCQPKHYRASRGDLVSKTGAGGHSLQREGLAEPRPGGRTGGGRRGMSCTLETKLRTLDLDTAYSHCPLLSRPTRLQLSTARLPRPVPQFQASSPTTALAGWHTARHKRPQNHWRRFNQVPYLVQ